MHLLCISNMQNLYYIVWSPPVARVHTMWKNIAYNWYIKKLFLTIGDEQIYFWFHEENTFCEPIYIYIYIYCLLSFFYKEIHGLNSPFSRYCNNWMIKKKISFSFSSLLLGSIKLKQMTPRWSRFYVGYLFFFFFFLRKLCGLLN